MTAASPKAAIMRAGSTEMAWHMRAFKSICHSVHASAEDKSANRLPVYNAPVRTGNPRTQC
eukprot:2843059-Pleurochrysis_carterae.AAC.1